MNFEIGQKVWLLNAKADEYSSPAYPCLYPKTFALQEATISNVLDEDGLVQIELKEPGGASTLTYVEPSLLLLVKPNLDILNSF